MTKKIAYSDVDPCLSLSWAENHVSEDMRWNSAAVLFARDAHEAGQRLGREQRWQPIATAPLDGTMLLVFEHAHGSDMYGIGYWFDGSRHNSSSGWICHAFHAVGGSGRAGGSITPTHWMPMPAPARQA
jgi:hypothetical protein